VDAAQDEGLELSLSARDIDVHVGQRLRERREALGISQGKLGRHLGLTFSQVQKYEKGSNRIGAGRLFQIADYLGVPPSHFFEGLANGRPARSGEAQPVSAAAPEEVRQLTAAFGAISEPSTRASVLALVRSLADEDRTRSGRRSS
jgi:transcriptional regulator with XRE-family HTH domain